MSLALRQWQEELFQHNLKLVGADVTVQRMRPGLAALIRLGVSQATEAAGWAKAAGAAQKDAPSTTNGARSVSTLTNHRGESRRMSFLQKRTKPSSA